MPNKVLLFDNVDVSDYFGTWQESANARLNAVSVPRRHGALLSDAVVQDVRQIQIAGTLLTPDNTALGLRTIIDTLSELFSRLGKRLQLWDDRYVTAYKATFTWKYVEGSGLRAADFQLNFSCPDPFWYYVLTNSPVTTLNGLIALDITNNIYSQIFVLTNNGTFVAYPVWTITAVGDTISKIVLTNTTLGRSFTYIGTIVAGTSLVVDVSGFTVTNNGVADLTNWSGDFIWLLAGANSITATLTFTGAPTAGNLISITWPDRKY